MKEYTLSRLPTLDFSSDSRLLLRLSAIGFGFRLSASASDSRLLLRLSALGFRLSAIDPRGRSPGGPDGQDRLQDRLILSQLNHTENDIIMNGFYHRLNDVV